MDDAIAVGVCLLREEFSPGRSHEFFWVGYHQVGMANGRWKARVVARWWVPLNSRCQNPGARPGPGVPSSGFYFERKPQTLLSVSFVTVRTRRGYANRADLKTSD